jgi:hypothetical protein
VSNEKFSLFMGLFLLLLVFNATLVETSYAGISLAATFYLFFSGLTRRNSITDDILTLISIVVMYILTFVTLPSSFIHSNVWVYVTFVLFWVVSLMTIIWTVKALIKKTTANKSITASRVEN